MKEIVVFSLSNELYGIDIRKIKGIIVYNQLIITPLFKEKDYILGIANVRGEVIPIVDLRIKFGYKADYDEDTVVILIYTSEEKWIGIVVDFILKIVEIEKDEIKQPQLVDGIDKKYLEGLVRTKDNEMVTLFNIDVLLSVEEL